MIDPKKSNKSHARFMSPCLKAFVNSGKTLRKIRQVLQSQLTRLDLVNREEFDVQTQVLLRTARSWRCWNSAWPSWKAN